MTHILNRKHEKSETLKRKNNEVASFGLSCQETYNVFYTLKP